MLKKKIEKCDIVLVLITIVFAIGITMFQKNHPNEVSLYNSSTLSYVKAEVIQVVDDQTEMKEDGRYYGVQVLSARILEGDFKNQEVSIDNYLSSTHNVRLYSGQNFIACIDHPDQADSLITVYNYDRIPYIYAFIGVLIALVILIGRSKGARTVISLAFTFYAIVSLLLPMIFHGYSPATSTIFVIVLTIGYTLFMLNGNSLKTWVATFATTIGVILSGVCFELIQNLIHISGYNTDQAEALILISQQTGLQINEILFAGILISCLGAVMDVGMSISSSLFEIKTLNPKITARQIFQSGISIGKDMIGTMCNTLILAFTGSSMTTLVTFLAYSIQYQQLMNSDFIATEMIQGIAGTIGIVLTVPVGALLSAWIYTRFYQRKYPNEQRSDVNIPEIKEADRES